MVLPIEHYLMGSAGTRFEDVRVIYSHPQALAQCREYLESKFPSAERSASLSTAQAVGDALQSNVPAVAIAPRRSAELYNAEILDSRIQDVATNVTRFVVLARSDHAPTGNDKTSLFFTFDADVPGQLYTVMGEFAHREINLAKIESRPTKRSLGQYVFFVDCDGHREDGLLGEAIEAVRTRVSSLRVMGSYPSGSSSYSFPDWGRPGSQRGLSAAPVSLDREAAENENRPPSCSSCVPTMPHIPKGWNTREGPIGRILCPVATGTLPATKAIALDTGTPDRRSGCLPPGTGRDIP